MDAATWLRSVGDAGAKTQQSFDALTELCGKADTIDRILKEAPALISEIFDAQSTYLFGFEKAKGQLFTIASIGNDFKEVRVPIGPTSIAGFVGITKVVVNVRNAYDAAELGRIHAKLRFDDHLDQLTGTKTRALLSVPILAENELVGLFQVVNKKKGLAFMPRDVTAAESVVRAMTEVLDRFSKVTRGPVRRKGKWDGLLERGLIQPDALKAAMTEAAASNTDLARHFIEKVGLSRANVEKSLVEHYGCEFFRFTGKETIPGELKARVRVDFLKTICAIPVEIRGQKLVVVIDDPSDIMRTDALSSIDPDRELVFKVGFRDEILACIEHAFGQRGDVGIILRELAADETTGDVEDGEGDEESRGAESDSAVIKLANQIILDAYRRGASDIHIEPNGKERNTSIRFRIDGDCVEYQEIPAQYRLPLVARIKIMSRLDISERRKPQDGKIRFRLQDRNIELRVATIPTVNGNEDVVMRILAASKPIPIEKMGMNDRNLAVLKSLVKKPYGLVLVVGPTGSGKTTTLHSALGFINEPDTKIWTAEDPVEITQPGLRQVQVQPKIGFDFSTAMRAFLRADPDVIMVGEMRDKETASTGVEASLTGHLVLSTLHTNSAPETITRLVDMGLDVFSFADALLGVLAQRLTRAICPRCKESYDPEPDEINAINQAFGLEESTRRGYESGKYKLWRGVGCDTCNKTGYKGRLAVHELLENNDDIKRAITTHAQVSELRKAAIAGGMTTLLQDGIEKAMAGKTDLKQVLAVCSR